MKNSSCVDARRRGARPRWIGLLVLLAGASGTMAAPPVTAKAELLAPCWSTYGIGAVHGPMPGAHFDPWVVVPPFAFWLNLLTVGSPALLPKPVLAMEAVWHLVAVHPGEAAPVGPYFVPCMVPGPMIPLAFGFALGFGAGFGGQAHPPDIDLTNNGLAVLYAPGGAVLGYAYCSVGVHGGLPGQRRYGPRSGALAGVAVVPQTDSTAVGSAVCGVRTPENNEFVLAITVLGIARADLVDAQLRLGGPGENGPAILDLGPISEWHDLEGQGISRTLDSSFPAAYIDDLLAGRTYAQISTVAYPSGEIRGQLVAPAIYSNSDDLTDPFRVTRAGGHCSVDGDATDLQTTLGLNTYGWGAQASADNSVADDFVVPAGQTWVIDGLVLYLYQTGASGATITGVDYAFSTTDLLGQPPLVWTNVPVDASLSDSFRKRDIDAPTEGCTRRLQRVFVPLPDEYVAEAGPHWLAWRATGSGSFSGPWQMPVVIAGQPQKPGANGMQSTNNGPYAYIVDGGTAQAQQDFVFELTGYAVGTPTPLGACCYDDGICIVVPPHMCGHLLGDADCDGAVDFDDINAFVLVLSGGLVPGCPPANCDCDQDGDVDFDDINKFVEFISGGAPVTGVWLGSESTCADCAACTIQCPPGALDEGEPCYTDTNGGCNSTPYVFDTISCGDTVCGTSWFDGSTRDTDWYLLNTTTPAVFMLTGEAEFDLQLLMVQDTGGDCVGYNYWYIWADLCDTVTLNSACLPPDIYYVWVGPQFTTPFGCTDGDYQYWATLQCVPCEPAPDPAPPAPSAIEYAPAAAGNALLSNTVSTPN